MKRCPNPFRGADMQKYCGFVAETYRSKLKIIQHDLRAASEEA